MRRREALRHIERAPRRGGGAGERGAAAAAAAGRAVARERADRASGQIQISGGCYCSHFRNTTSQTSDSVIYKYIYVLSFFFVKVASAVFAIPTNQCHIIQSLLHAFSYFPSKLEKFSVLKESSPTTKTAAVDAKPDSRDFGMQVDMPALLRELEEIRR